MRAVDADELKEQFSWSEVCRLSILEINQIIDDAPTIRPEDDAQRIINVIEYTFELSKDAIIDYNYWNWIKNIIKAGGLK